MDNQTSFEPEADKKAPPWRRTARAVTVGLLLSFQAVAASAATTILFIGNSYTQGFPEAMNFRPNTVTDLNGGNTGGVPALFKAFTVQAGLDYDVSHELVGGSNLDLHYNTKLPLIAKAWDKVVWQGYSTLDADLPGDPTKIVTYSGLLADAFHSFNPNVDISVMATWARADETYLPSGHWYGKPISAMAYDVQAAYELAKTTHARRINRVIPVGLTWNRAMDRGVADPNPYDITLPPQINLWTVDSYHASRYGSYLEALVIFGTLTGIDPRTFGNTDPVALELGIIGSQAYALQSLAWEMISETKAAESTRKKVRP